jgi:hypothetical protein
MATLQAPVRPRAIENPAQNRRRPFGCHFAPQNQVYFLYLPFVLGSFGAAVWAFPTDFMFVLGALVGSLAGIYVLVDIVFRAAPLRLTTICGMTILLGYNLGSFNTWLTLQRGTLTVAEITARDPSALGRAIAACMVTAALLVITGELFERPLFGSEFYLTFGVGTLPLVFSTTLLLAAAYASGNASFTGLAVDESGHISPATQLILWWYTPAYAYTVCAAVNTTGVTRLIVRIMAVIQTLALVPFGRRQFAFAVLLALIATRLGRFRLRLPLYKKVLIGIAGIVLVTVASVSFFYLRVAGWRPKAKGNLSLVERFENAYDLLQQRDPAEILALMGTNVSQRTFVIGFFSDLLEASQRSKLLGKDLVYNMQLAVPSAISRDKFGILPYAPNGGGEEVMANMQWGFSYIDEANSLITAGAADFGFLGVLLYPLAFSFLLRFAAEWIQYIVPTRTAVIISFAYVYESLQAETSPGEYFLQIRSTILVVVILYILARLPAFRLRSLE